MKIFFIYAEKDKTVAQQFYEKLIQIEGVECWLPTLHGKGDEPERAKQIHFKMTECNVFLLIISSLSKMSRKSESLYERAMVHKKPIYICLMDEVHISETYVKEQAENVYHVKESDEGILKTLSDVFQNQKTFQGTNDNKNKQNIRQTPRNSPEEERQYTLRQLYLRQTKTQVSQLRLSRISGEAADVPLGAVFIPIPTKLTLDVVIKDSKVIDWDIREKVTDIHTSGITKTRKNFYQVLRGRADKKIIEPLIIRVQELINQGIGDDYSNPLDRPLFLAPPWYDGVKYEFWTLTTSDIIAISSRLVILGQPGSGKSTVAQHLTLCLLNSQLDGGKTYPSIENLGCWMHGKLTPIYIELRKMVGWELFPTIDQPISNEHFWEYIKQKILGPGLADLEDSLQNDLLNGRAIIILDGIDEIPIPSGKGALEKRRKQVKELARKLDILYPESRILFTSRNYGYMGWELEGYAAVELCSFKEQQMHNLAENIYSQLISSPSEALKKASSLMKALETVPNSLKDRPLFFTLIATIFLSSPNNKLPSSKGELYYRSIMLLLDRWTQPRLEERSLAEQIGCDIKELYSRLERLAFDTHQRSSSDNPEDIPSIDFPTLLHELFKATGGSYIDKILAFLSQQSGVLASPGSEKFQFAHRSFQEYLAASYLVQNKDWRKVRVLIESQPQIWREPCLLIGDILLQELNGDFNAHR